MRTNIDEQGQIRIPLEICAQAGLQPGTEVDVTVQEKEIHVARASANAGNSITVRVGRFSDEADVILTGERTVAKALNQAGINASGCNILVNGAPAGIETQLKDGDQIFILRAIAGQPIKTQDEWQKRDYPYPPEPEWIAEIEAGLEEDKR